jgi:hypothetical protein
LANALLGDLTVRCATMTGVAGNGGEFSRVRPGAVAFRHELSRRAVDGSLTVCERMQLNGKVWRPCCHRDSSDLPRIVLHGLQAGDDAAFVPVQTTGGHVFVIVSYVLPRPVPVRLTAPGRESSSPAAEID